jgi:hypothetical protein
MKTIKQTFYLSLICLALVASGCSKNNDDGSGGDTGGGSESFSAKVDGSNFSASNDPATLIGARLNSGVFTAQGSDNSGNAINFTINSYTGAETYRTGDLLTNPNLIQYVRVSPTGAWGSNLATAALGTLTPGTIVITSDNGTVVEGTFSFEGYNSSDMSTKMITEGRFKVNLD